MKLTLKKETLTSTKAELIVLPIIEKARNKAFEDADRILGGALTTLAKKEGFNGQVGRSLIWLGADPKLPKLIAVGVGRKAGDPSRWRQAIGRAMRFAKGHKVKTVSVFVDKTSKKLAPNKVRWTAEALCLADYRFDKYKSKSTPSTIKSAAVVMVPPTPPSAELKRALIEGKEAASGIDLTRDLVNEPANTLGPTEFTRRAKQVAAGSGLECKVIGAAALKRMGANLLLAVGAASDDKPRLVHLTYRPKQPKAKVALVGKGVTFDSGGLCIKPGKSMATMKTDMAGAATVLGIMSVLSAFSIPVEVHGIIPLAENSVGSGAMRPGDVFASMSGLTVEIINTDAEGRLILADAITYTSRLNPDVIIDHATLTGACTIALGNHRAGAFSNTDSLAQEYMSAANCVGERFWTLPLAEELRGELTSPVADLKNVGGRYGGAITAALFLERFALKTPWLHLDIAGPARSERNTDLCPKGGSGFGVLTAVEYLRGL